MNRADLGTVFSLFVSGVFFGLGFTLSAIAVCALVNCFGGWLW